MIKNDELKYVINIRLLSYFLKIIVLIIYFINYNSFIMEKLFIQLIYIMFFLIKYTKCDIYLEKIEEITEKDKTEILLFTEYKKNSLLGVSNQNIYIISPFRVTKKNYSNEFI